MQLLVGFRGKSRLEGFPGCQRSVRPHALSGFDKDNVFSSFSFVRSAIEPRRGLFFPCIQGDTCLSAYAPASVPRERKDEGVGLPECFGG